MVNLVVNNNKVTLSKHQEGWEDFVAKYLIKYESITKVDPYNSTRSHKVYRTVQERRNLYTEDDNNIYFTRGIMFFVEHGEALIEDISKDNLNPVEIDKDEIRSSPKNFSLRDDQVVAVVKCLFAGRGVIQLPTAIGKSVIITSVVKQLLKYNPEMRVLVLAPTLSTVENINSTFVEEGIDTTIYGHSEETSEDTPVTTSLVQSLLSGTSNEEYLSRFDAVFYDECHHLQCDTWNKLNSMLCNVKYSIGFSALSIDKSEIREKDFTRISYTSSLIMSATGPVLMHMDMSYYIDKGIVALPILLRVSHKVELPAGFDESAWSKLSKVGLMSESRTYKVATAAKLFSDYNRKSLILISEKNYAYKVCQQLYELGVQTFGISFGAGKGYIFKGVTPGGEVEYEGIESLEVLKMLNEDKLSIIIGTSHIDEGVDLKGLDCLILASGGKKDRRVVQRVGRVMRPSKTGKYAYIVDFTDECSRVLSRQSNERLRMYYDTIGIPRKNVFDRIPVGALESKFKELESIERE